jgi:N-acetylglutamate synthase-like GNAT family acetyltransferase
MEIFNQPSEAEVKRLLSASNLNCSDLTNTAEDFFRHRGYQRCRREVAPSAIRETKEFCEICPVSSAFMVKNL